MALRENDGRGLEAAFGEHSRRDGTAREREYRQIIAIGVLDLCTGARKLYARDRQKGFDGW